MRVRDWMWKALVARQTVHQNQGRVPSNKSCWAGEVVKWCSFRQYRTSFLFIDSNSLFLLVGKPSNCLWSCRNNSLGMLREHSSLLFILIIIDIPLTWLVSGCLIDQHFPPTRGMFLWNRRKVSVPKYLCNFFC